MADALSGSSFVMQGARAAMEGGMSHIEQHVAGIERAVTENPGLAFDLAKTLIESACKSILDERGVSFEPTDDLPRLFKSATSNLPFLPVAASGESGVKRSLEKTLGGLHTAVLGVCELRNQCGFASHGSPCPRPAMEEVQAVLAAGAADAIVGFLHRVHRQQRIAPPKEPAGYEDNPDFNDYVDETCQSVRIFDLEYRASDVLYHMDPKAYVAYLTSYEPEAPGEQEEGEGPIGEEGTA